MSLWGTVIFYNVDYAPRRIFQVIDFFLYLRVLIFDIMHHEVMSLTLLGRVMGAGGLQLFGDNWTLA